MTILYFYSERRKIDYYKSAVAFYWFAVTICYLGRKQQWKICMMSLTKSVVYNYWSTNKLNCRNSPQFLLMFIKVQLTNFLRRKKKHFTIPLSIALLCNLKMFLLCYGFIFHYLWIIDVILIKCTVYKHNIQFFIIYELLM